MLFGLLNVGLGRDRRPRGDVRKTMSMSSLGSCPFRSFVLLPNIAGKRDPRDSNLKFEQDVNMTAFPLPPWHFPVPHRILRATRCLPPDSWTNFWPFFTLLANRDFLLIREEWRPPHHGMPFLFFTVIFPICPDDFENLHSVHNVHHADQDWMFALCLLIPCGGGGGGGGGGGNISFLSRPHCGPEWKTTYNEMNSRF